MPRYLHASCLVTLAAGVAWGEGSLTPRTEARLRQGLEVVRVVCFGDSVTGIYYHTGGRRAWPELLAQALGQAYPQATVSVTNAGISGNTTTAALARLQRDVLDRQPHLVVVMFGLNDLAYGAVEPTVDTARQDLYRGNLEKLVEGCRQAGAEVLLMTPNNVYPEAAPARPPARLTRYVEIMRAAGAALGVPVVDAYAEYERRRQADVRGWRVLMSETIHPALPGHQLFAEAVAGAVCGRPVSLGVLTPSRPCLTRTAAAIGRGQALTVIVADSLRQDVAEALQAAGAGTDLTLVSWPVQGQSLAALEAWAKGIRQQVGRVLVVGMFSPESLTLTPGPGEEAFGRQAAWVASWSLDFGARTWDVLFVSPRVSVDRLTPEQQAGADLARAMVEAHDLVWLEPAGDTLAARQAAWRDGLRQELAASRETSPRP